MSDSSLPDPDAPTATYSHGASPPSPADSDTDADSDADPPDVSDHSDQSDTEDPSDRPADADTTDHGDSGSRPDATPPDWHTPADIALLEYLAAGRCTQGQLSDQTGYSKTQVYNRLQILLGRGYVVKVHHPTAIYGLTPDGVTLLDRLDITPVDAPDTVPCRPHSSDDG